jgi:single-strand DNA-binding protein
MTEASVSFAGNLTEDPEVRYTDSGIPRAMFRVAVSGRREQEPSFFTVIVWRDQAEHAAQSLSKGSRVVVMGRLQQRAWSAEDGSARSVVEVVAEELGPSLRWRRRPRPRRRRPAASSGVVVATALLSAVGAGRRLPAGPEIPAPPRLMWQFSAHPQPARCRSWTHTKATSRGITSSGRNASPSLDR